MCASTSNRIVSCSSDAHDSSVPEVEFPVEFTFRPYRSQAGIVHGSSDAQDSE